VKLVLELNAIDNMPFWKLARIKEVMRFGRTKQIKEYSRIIRIAQHFIQEKKNQVIERAARLKRIDEERKALGIRFTSLIKKRQDGGLSREELDDLAKQRETLREEFDALGKRSDRDVKRTIMTFDQHLKEVEILVEIEEQQAKMDMTFQKISKICQTFIKHLFEEDLCQLEIKEETIAEQVAIKEEQLESAL